MIAHRFETMTLHVAGEPSGHYQVRMFTGEGVDWAAPTRDTKEAADADLARLEAEGIRKFRVALPGRGFTVYAVDAETACDIALERWGSYPYDVTAARA